MSLKQYYFKTVGNDVLSDRHGFDDLDMAILQAKNMLSRLGPGYMAKVYNTKHKQIGCVKYHTDGIQIFYHPSKHPMNSYVIRHNGKHNLKAYVG